MFHFFPIKLLVYPSLMCYIAMEAMAHLKYHGLPIKHGEFPVRKLQQFTRGQLMFFHIPIMCPYYNS